jgi:hypothetical protein
VSDKFLIDIDQLKKLIIERDPATRFFLAAEVMTHPYYEKTAMEVIGSSLVRGIGAVVDALNKWLNPPKKR